MSDAFDVHVVPHTHWDREWYQPAGRFRQRLVSLIDELLDAGPPPVGAFLLDGQSVVLDDYLAVRPEREGELSAWLRAGHLEAGPWYVLADELIPSGEALVRNLLAGRRTLQSLGAAPPAVLYSPDAFGHPAALPAVAHGFSCPLVILWRGFGGRRWPPGDTFLWREAGGKSVVLYHLPPDGYELGSNLPADDAAARDRWTRMRAELAPRSRLGVLLVQNGADHHAPQARFDEALEALARAARPNRVVRSSLSAFAADLAGRIMAREASGAVDCEDDAIPAVAGELRDSYGYTWTLQGTFGTRAAQKRCNAGVERLLSRDAEPWAALAALAGGESRVSVTAAAWRTLLLCHPHDTLCGCSIDDVARAMDARLEDAHAQALGLRDDAVLDLVGHDPAAARTTPAAWRSVLLVRNPAARERGGVAEVELVRFVRDVGVGPGSAGAPASEPLSPAAVEVVVDGGAAPVQELARELRYERIESPRHYPDNDLVEVQRAVVWLPPVAGYAVHSFALRESRRRTRAAPPAPVRARGRTIESDTLRLVVDRGGRLRLSAESLGLGIDDLVRFESAADFGDTYTPSLRGAPVDAVFASARVVDRGPLRATLEVRWRLRVPERRAMPATGDERRTRGGRRVRTIPEVTIPIAARVSLDAGAPYVRVAISGENRARDHRLRVVFSTGMRHANVFADAAFGPVRREPIVVPAEDSVRETPPPTAPLHRYLSLYGAGGGVTLFSDGLAEYEATARGEIAVTLVRAVGELSRADLPERPGHAGWPAPTPDAQSPGPFAGAFAIMPHGGRSPEVLDAVERAADDVLTPLAGTTLRSALGLYAPAGRLELRGAGLAFSTAKESEDGEWLVLRCVNVTEQPAVGSWELGIPVREAWSARLDETPLERLHLTAGRIAFAAGAHQIVTVLVR